MGRSITRVKATKPRSRRVRAASIALACLLLVISLGSLGALGAAPPPSSAPPAPDPDFVIPPRISRLFFDSPVEARVVLSEVGGGGVTVRMSSAVSWKELPPEGPPPRRGTYAADFRDRWGCAILPDARSTEVCFRIMPDVSSLDLTRERMKIEGLNLLIQEAIPTEGCGPRSTWQKPRFVLSAREGEGFVATYRVERSGTPECPPVQVDFYFRARRR